MIRDFLFRYVARYNRLALLSLFLMLVVALSRMAPAYILKVAVDRYIGRGDLRGLSAAALLYLCFICLEYGAMYFQVYVTQLFGQSVIRQMRMETFVHLMRLPVPYFDRTPLGKNLHYVTSDMESINEFITSGIVTSVGDIITITGILAVMLYLSMPLTAVVMLFFFILVPIVDIFRRCFHRAYQQSRESVSEMNAFMGESLAGIYVAKAFDREGEEMDRFAEKNARYRLVFKKVILYLSLYFPFVESIGILSILAILWSSGYLLSFGAVTFGTIVAFIEYSHKLYNPIRDLSEKYNLYQNAQSSLEKLHRLHATEPEESARGRPALDVAGDVELRDVWLSYENDDMYALKGINLRIREGEKLGIVGLTGSGKTSLINLLLGFYMPTRGEIRIGGRPIADYSLESLRKAFGIVSQDVYVFPRTIRENLFVADDKIHPGLDRLIRGFSQEGAAKLIAEEGRNLSEGEKQLIAIGRVIAYRPRYIILDEATSRIDRYLEKSVRGIMEEELGQATWLVIAHRISTMAEMDRIVVIHNGELAEEGDHCELLERKGIYHHLYSIYKRGGQL
ncbi:MAG: ABC transporter ATP-binding protein [Syntrophorhabdales bacterium]